MTVALSVVNSITATANQTAIGGTNNDPIIALANNAILPGTGSVTIPSGTTAQRVLSGVGSLRVNTTTGFAEISTDGATWVDLAVGGGGIASVNGTPNRITSTGGVNPIIDIDAAYVGQNSITTLGTISTGVWAGTPIVEIHGGTNQTTYALGDTLYASAANTLAKLPGNITAGIQYLAQTGTGVVSAAPAWTTISGGDITGAALTKVDDTNVTLTLGGAPATALLRAASITAGWAGQLSLARGGSNADLSATVSNGGIVWTNATQMQVLAGTATASKMLLSGATAPPSWSTSTIPSSAGAVVGKVLASDGTNYALSTATFPIASATAGKIIRSDGTNWLASTATFADTYTASNLLYSNGANTVTGLATANSASLVTSSTGVPAWSGTMTNGQVIIGSTGATPTAATLTAGVSSGIAITNGAASITIATNGVLKSYQVFTSGSAATYTKPAGINNILVWAVGGGGGGGGCAATTASTNAAAGGGGGGGSFGALLITGAAATYTYTVGTGGNGGAAGNNAGSDGNDTTFSTLIARKGLGGAGSAPAGAPTLTAAGGSGGSSSGQTYGANGQAGFGGINFSTAGVGIAIGGAGGCSGLFMGPGGIPNPQGQGGTTNGGVGSISGGGGSGAASTGNNVAGAGGNGGDGIIIVWEFS